MNVRSISTLKASLPHKVHDDNSTIPAIRSGLSRRQFTRTAAGTALVGATLGSGLWNKAMAAPKGAFAPVPIPGGSPFLGGSCHIFRQTAFDPIDAEPTTITNLNAFVGLAYISGMVTQTDTKTGQTARYPFLDSDMRFMQGDFRGTDGRIHQATFAFI